MSEISTSRTMSACGPVLGEAESAVRHLDALQAKIAGVDRLLRQNDSSHALLRTSLRAVLIYDLGRRTPPERRIEEMAVAAAETAERLLSQPFERKAITTLHRRIHANSWSLEEAGRAGVMRHAMIKCRDHGAPVDDLPDILDAIDRLASQSDGSLGTALIIACRLHWRLARAKPFDSGNAVLAKVLLPACVRMLGAKGYGSAYISESAADDLETYAAIIASSNEIAAVRALLAMIAHDARRNAKRVEALIALQKEASRAVAGLRSDSMLHRIAPWTVIRPALNTRRMHASFDVSTHHMFRLLDRLATRGVIARVSKSPAIFLNREAFEIMTAR